VTSTSDPVIALRGLGKRYVKYDDAPMLATALMRLPSRTRRSALWAVRNIDLTVDQGECVGIIGRNGSGKSTLLQMISGITAPTEGRLRVRGRIAPLISVGVGFHPELSGRDNLYVNGAILGLSRAEINRRFDDVVAFAEMGSFIDTPVKFYSSGMAVRLGFSMAIQSTPDVLIVDEVLAVGDLAFQMKCYDRMAAIRKEGTTVLVVSHNLNAVRTLCDRVMLMNQGQTHYEGDPAEGISQLHDLLQEQRELGESTGEERTPYEAGTLEVEKVELIGAKGKSTNEIDSGDTIKVRFHVKALKDVDKPFIFMTVHGPNGMPVYGEGNRLNPFGPIKAGDQAVYDISVQANFVRGSYLLRTMVGRRLDGIDARRCAIPRPISFYVSGRMGVIGIADFGADFEVKSQPNGKGQKRGRSTGAAAKPTARSRSRASG
jgi:ABC-type polysaccharide/polyol phosphate transport system ATPase subunit